jgi:hypothetical protein
VLSIFNPDGEFKIAIRAYRTHGSEFLLYVWDLEKTTKWEDVFEHRLAIFNVRPTKNIREDLEGLMRGNGMYNTYYLADIII